MWTFDLVSSRPGASPRRWLRWLRDRLAAQGVPALGPHALNGGWGLLTHADDGDVFIRVEGGGARLCVDFSGDAEVEAQDAAQAVAGALAGVRVRVSR